MTRVATTENEEFLMTIAERGTAANVEFLAQKYQLCKRLRISRENNTDEEDDWKRDTEFTWYQEETGMYVLRVRLPPEEGALVIKALDLIVAENKKAEQAPEEPEIDPEIEAGPLHESGTGKKKETDASTKTKNKKKAS